MVLFPNATITIYRETKNGSVIGYDDDDTPILLDCGMDGYSNIPTCLCVLNKVVGDFQPLSSVENQVAYGNVDQSVFSLNLDLGVDIKKTDKITVEGYDDYTGYYEVIGTPRQLLSLFPHIEVSLTKERK